MAEKFRLLCIAGAVCLLLADGPARAEPTVIGDLVFAVESEPKGQALRVERARHGDARQARHVHGHREDIVEIHLDRITAFFARR